MFREIIPLSIRKSLGNWWTNRRELKKHAAILEKLSGSGVQCNICGWEGRAFADDIWHPATICPVCKSQVRHRLLAATFDGHSNQPELKQNSLLNGKAILHFAPERQLRDRIRQLASRYTTADYDRGDCDLKLNMSAMPELEDSLFDIVIACDVLEHVPDDMAAMRELHRILKPMGTAILTVPQKDSPSSTDEDASVTALGDRERRFGQKDHMRMYGDDFPERLSRCGFSVNILTVDCFPATIANKHILSPPFPNPNPLATNKRSLYFSKII